MPYCWVAIVAVSVRVWKKKGEKKEFARQENKFLAHDMQKPTEKNSPLLFSPPLRFREFWLGIILLRFSTSSYTLSQAS